MLRNYLSKIRAGALGLSLVAGLASCGQSKAPVQEVTVDTPIDTQAITSTGLSGQYFNNMDFTGTSVTQLDSTISKSWGTKAPVKGIDPTTYSVRWLGQVSAAYNQVYTFYLSSSGGARLMVNGKTIVNDWADHALKTSSGTVTLAAGKKYDIRLEYYRNTANVGTVKLEWQSASQARQVVPSTSLSSGNMDVTAALATLRASPDFKSVGVTVDAVTSRAGRYKDDSVLLITRGSDGSAFQVYIANGTINDLYRQSAENGNIIFSDLKNKRVLNLGAASQYFSSTGNSTDAQVRLLAQKLAPFYSENFYIEADINQTSASVSNNLGSLSFLSSICGTIIKPPPSCAGGRCEANAEAYSGSICDAIDLGANAGKAVFTNAKDLLTWGDNVADAKDLGSILPHKEAWKKYLECINDPLLKTVCIIGIDSDREIYKQAQVNTSGEASVRITNSTGQPAPNAANVSLQATVNFTRADTGISTLLNGLVVKLLPEGSQNFAVPYVCPPNPTVLYAEISYSHNANIVKNDKTTVVIDCLSLGAQISEPQPNPLKLKGLVGETTSGVVTFSNTGASPLSFALVDTSGITVSADGVNSLLPGATATVRISYVCPATPGTYQGMSFAITNNDVDPVDQRKVVGVEAECTSPEPYLSNLAPNPIVISLPVRQSIDVKLTFKNTGGSNLVYTVTDGIIDYTWYTTHDFYINKRYYSETVEPNETEEIIITTTCPNRRSITNGTITIRSNAKNASEIQIPISRICTVGPAPTPIWVGNTSQPTNQEDIALWSEAACGYKSAIEVWDYSGLSFPDHYSYQVGVRPYQQDLGYIRDMYTGYFQWFRNDPATEWTRNYIPYQGTADFHWSLFSAQCSNDNVTFTTSK